MIQCIECGGKEGVHEFGCAHAVIPEPVAQVLSGCAVRAAIQEEQAKAPVQLKNITVREYPPTEIPAARWTISNAGWVQDQGRPVAKIFGHGVDNPTMRIQAVRAAALIVNAPEAVDVIRGLMSVNLRDGAQLRVAMDRARAWLKLTLEPEGDIP